MTATIRLAPWHLATSFLTFEESDEALAILNAAGIPVGVEAVERRGPNDDPSPGSNHRSVAVVVPAGRVREARVAIIGMRERTR